MLICCLSCKKLYKSYLLIAFLTVLFQSCELEPNVPENSIRAQILNEDGFTFNTHSINEITASIGDYPIVPLAKNGFFTISNVPGYYDINITTFNEEYGPYTLSYLFKNLTKSNPILILKPALFDGYTKYCWFHVHFPPISVNRIGIIKFISKDIFIQYSGETIVREHDDSAFVPIDIPVYENYVSGKLLFFECGGSWEDEIQIEQFEKYGSKDVNIKSNEIKDIVFSESDISFNPLESSVNYEVTLPPNYPGSYVFAKLNFEGYNAQSCMTVAKHSDPTQYNSVVPASLDIPFKVRVISLINYTSGYFDQFKSVDIQPGETGKVIHETIDLISPAKNQQNVNLYTNLEISDYGENGVYIFNFEGYNSNTINEFQLFTDRKNLKIWEVNSRVFKIEPNSAYRWYVVKLGGFNSIDELTEQVYGLNTKLNSCSVSNMRFFRTCAW